MFPVHTSVVVMPAISVEVATAASVFYLALLLKSRKGKKKRKTWVRKFLEKGSVHGKLLLEDLRLDGAGFINFLRMSTSDFEILLRMVAPKISRRNTKYRKAITPDIRLAITLRYLASGDSFTSLMYTFRISKQTISTVVPEVCEALISALKGYIKVSKQKGCIVKFYFFLSLSLSPLTLVVFESKIKDVFTKGEKNILLLESVFTIISSCTR